MIPDTTHVREVSRVEHPSPWRAAWQTSWNLRHRTGRTEELCIALVERVATGNESEISEAILAARYAAGKPRKESQ